MLDEPEPKKLKMEETENEGNPKELEKYDFPPDTYTSSMLKDINFKDSLLSVTERYLTPYYRLDVTKPGDDICIWIHSNKICVVGLAPSSNILKERISQVTFKVSDKLDRATNRVSGKSKHGAQPLQENSNLCVIKTANDQTHSVKCCMVGKLVEVNEKLVENPELLRNPPHKSGYLAIVLLNLKMMDKMINSLLTQSQYEIALKKRDGES